jgi:hypothetical protein
VKTPPHDSAGRNKPAKAESIWDAAVREAAIFVNGQKHPTPVLLGVSRKRPEQAGQM